MLGGNDPGSAVRLYDAIPTDFRVLTDTLPVGAIYYAETNVVQWQGTVSRGTVQTVTFSVLASGQARGTVTNTAIITDSFGRVYRPSASVEVWPPVATSTPTPTPSTCQSGVVQVDIQNFAFSSQTIAVCAGATVRWTNLDSVPHTTTSDTGIWDSGLLNQNQSFSFTFGSPGTYAYHCTPHPSMHGTIRVVAPTGMAFSSSRSDPE